MKKIILVLLGISLIASVLPTSCSDDDDTYTPSSSVVEVFYDYYPDASNVRWYYVYGYLVADFDYNDTDMEAWFSGVGTWLYTKIDISYEELPAEIQNSLNINYPYYDIDDVREINTSKYGTFYNVDIDNDNEYLSLLYDEDGVLVNIYANVLPYTWWDTLD